jgi:glycosyltransferase involved in cell wall biosynthesis
MKIGIDARLIGETGVGRYIRNLITELAKIDPTNEYIVFLRRPSMRTFQAPNSRWHVREAEIPWHSITEQFMMPWLFSKEHLDIVHIPYFNAPIFYPGRYIVTIHDLTILHFDTGKASTLPYWLYKVRRIGYRIILYVAVKRAAHILTVSEAVKKDIQKSFGEKDTRISVTHEGIDPAFLKPLHGKLEKLPIHGNFFLYVGNVYPHKNIEVLLQSYVLYKNTVKNPAKLLLIGPSDYFYGQLERLIPSLGLDKDVMILHRVSDSELQTLYHKACALVFPSRMEGFGLPALEALAAGCRVICSDIPVFREILGVHATYIDPTSPESLARAMKAVAQKPHVASLYKAKLVSFLSQYTWKKMAEKTFSVYATVVKNS